MCNLFSGPIVTPEELQKVTAKVVLTVQVLVMHFANPAFIVQWQDKFLVQRKLQKVNSAVYKQEGRGH